MTKPNKHKPMTPGVKLRRIRKSGTATTLQKKLWQAVLAAEDLLLSDGVTFNDQVRAVHALVQAAQAYAKILETTELQDQIDALREEFEALRQSPSLRKVV